MRTTSLRMTAVRATGLEFVGQAVEPAGSGDCQSPGRCDGAIPCRAGFRACRFLGLSVPRTVRTHHGTGTTGHFGGLESPPNRQAGKPAPHPIAADACREPIEDLHERRARRSRRQAASVRRGPGPGAEAIAGDVAVVDVVPESAHDMEDLARAQEDRLKGFLPPPTSPTPARLATIETGPDRWGPCVPSLILILRD